MHTTSYAPLAFKDWFLEQELAEGRISRFLGGMFITVASLLRSADTSELKFEPISGHEKVEQLSKINPSKKIVYMQLPKNGFRFEIHDFDIKEVNIEKIEFDRFQDKLLFGAFATPEILKGLIGQTLGGQKNFGHSTIRPGVPEDEKERVEFQDSIIVLEFKDTPIEPKPKEMPGLKVRLTGHVVLEVRGNSFVQGTGLDKGWAGTYNQSESIFA